MSKVLLVEDDKFLVRVYQLKLQKEGFEVIFLESGVGVEEKVVGEKPDAVVLDLVMPGRDGFEVLKGLKSKPETKEVPVIMLTALNSESDKKQCMDLGASDYLEKDMVTIKEVVETIRKNSKK